MLLKSDPIARRRSVFHESELDDAHYIESVQDVEPVMEANHEMRRHWTSAMDPHGEWGSFAGRIPVVIVDQLIRDGIFHDDQALLEWLERPENRAWKMHPGKFAARGRRIYV